MESDLPSVSRQFTVAIVGANHGHTKFYLGALSDDTRVRSVSLSGPKDHLAKYVDHDKVGPVFAQPRDMLDATDPDLVFVLGRHCDMAESAALALDRGVPIVLEKPGGMTSEDVAGIRTSARERGIPVLVPFVQRSGPLPGLFDAVGELRHAHLEFLAGPAKRYRDSGNSWLLDPATAGGGVLLNLGVHFIDMALWKAAGGTAPVEVRGQLTTIDPTIGVEDYASVTMTTASGAIAGVDCSYTYPRVPGRHVAYVLRGDDGFVSVDSTGRGLLTTPAGVVPFEIDVDSDTYYRSWVTTLLDGFDTGFPGVATISDLVAVRDVTDRVMSNSSKELRS